MLYGLDDALTEVLSSPAILTPPLLPCIQVHPYPDISLLEPTLKFLLPILTSSVSCKVIRT